MKFKIIDHSNWKFVHFHSLTNNYKIKNNHLSGQSTLIKYSKLTNVNQINFLGVKISLNICSIIQKSKIKENSLIVMKKIITYMFNYTSKSADGLEKSLKNFLAKELSKLQVKVKLNVLFKIKMKKLAFFIIK